MFGKRDADKTAAGVAGVSAAQMAVPYGLSLVGFTKSGVAAGSTAAAIHSSIGNVAAGSAFAWCQSVAVVGTTGSTVAPVALTASGAYIAYRNRDYIASAGRATGSLLMGAARGTYYVCSSVTSGSMWLASGAMSYFRR